MTKLVGLMMAYDSKCLDLAQYFLGCQGDDGDETQASLAQQIQDAVEDWFAAQPTAKQEAATVPEGDDCRQLVKH